jgi:nitrile hydratase beta subunit
MKLQHYLGGLEGLGRVEFDKRVFVEPWETRIFGIHTAMMALSAHLPLPQTSSTFHDKWTWASLRSGAEAMNPFDYFKYRYYEKWLGGISGFFIANGYITEAELEKKTEEFLKKPKPAKAAAGDAGIDTRVNQYLVGGDSPKRDIPDAPAYAEGDTVRIKNVPAADHTRLPGFLREKEGVVEVVYDGAYVYLCDTGPDGIGAAMPCYTLRFDPEHLWGDLAEKNFVIYADLYQHYLGDVITQPS